MSAERTNLADPGLFFRFALATTLVSVFVLTLLAAFLMAINMPETFDPANTKADHWAAVVLIGYFGLLLLLPIAFAVWMIGFPVFKGLTLLRGGPVFAGALVGLLFGWLASQMHSVIWLGPTVFGAVIGGFTAKTMSGQTYAVWARRIWGSR